MLKLDALNDAQREAVMHGEGPLLVLAGPGSGKTHTITQRILYLIEVMQVEPSEILVITFTKEAALSMQHRFREQSNRNYPVNFGTFHSVFYQILRNTNSSRTKQLWGESQKKNLIISILKNLNSSQKSHSVQNHDVTVLLSAVSFYKNTGDLEQSLQKLPWELKEQFQTLFRRYEDKRKAQGAIDFDDMVYECADILEKDTEARAYWSRRFSHILMDEFQDINPMQYRVISLLARSPYNLFAVGDDDQAIYGFRGSKPACMKQFEKDFGAKRVLLNINYRSYPEIVKASLQVIADNKERFPKQLLPCEAKRAEAAREKEAAKKAANGSAKDAVKNSVVLRSFTDKEDEYAYLMQELKNDCVNASDSRGGCAVLFRTNMHMQGFAARLNRFGIPYEMKEKTGSIYEHFIVKDIMAYLRLAQGEGDRSLMLQILNKPNRFISRESLYCPGNCSDKGLLRQMKKYYSESARLYDREDRISHRALEALSLLEKQLDYLKNLSPYPAVQYICKVIGYERYLSESVGRQASGFAERENAFSEEWQEILDFVKEDAREYKSMEQWRAAQKQFAEKLKQGLEQSKRPKAAGCGQGAHGEKSKAEIHLMTVHASKGLEFDKVYIPDCNERVFPHGSMPDKETCEEESRIFYVAMTRAKKNLELLYLTGTKERPRIPSRFLNPLL